MKARAIQLKESASLIILAKEKDLTRKYDYNVLLFNRSEKTSFMPNHAVFPGGVKESADETTLWLKYFKKFGVQDSFLTGLTEVQGPRPGIFKKTGPDCIEKEIGLRITAIRETFEEVGLFLCRGKDSLNLETKHGEFLEDFDRKHWQKEVHNDPTKFLQMCQQLNVVPDLWSLSEWSVWLTPASFKKRFETAFYLVTLNERPSLLREENEVATILWKNPEEFFEAYNAGEMWLPPPQCYELSRLASLFKIEELQKFASERSKKGSTLFLPIYYKCTDGFVGILPGDDNYPDNPNEISDLLHLNKTVDEFCSNVKRCHRTINTGINKGYVLLNFLPFYGHLSPLDMRKQGSKL